MNKRTCIQPSGLLEHELKVMERMTHHNRQLELEWVEKYSPRERWLYCTFKCPVSQRCKFENRYGERR